MRIRGWKKAAREHKTYKQEDRGKEERCSLEKKSRSSAVEQLSRKGTKKEENFYSEKRKMKTVGGREGSDRRLTDTTMQRECNSPCKETDCAGSKPAKKA